MYERAVERAIVAKREPRGVLFQFCGLREDECILGTAFSSHGAMAAGFSDFLVPGIMQDIEQGGRPFDFDRDEHEIEHLFISDRLNASELALIDAGEMFACISDRALPTVANYWKVVDGGGWFGPDAPQLAHVAYRKGPHVFAIDIWENRQTGDAFYAEHLHRQLEELQPGQLSDEIRAGSWIDLKTFLVMAPKDDALRHFRRPDADFGPSKI